MLKWAVKGIPSSNAHIDAEVKGSAYSKCFKYYGLMFEAGDAQVCNAENKIE